MNPQIQKASLAEYRIVDDHHHVPHDGDGDDDDGEMNL